MASEPGETRPPTILGPHGEGYCRVCHFIEPLSATGLIERHTRGAIMRASWDTEGTKPCKGSDRRPTKLTPFTSRLAAFRVTARSAVCPFCHTAAILQFDGRFTLHPDSTYRRCVGSGRLPA